MVDRTAPSPLTVTTVYSHYLSPVQQYFPNRGNLYFHDVKCQLHWPPSRPCVAPGRHGRTLAPSPPGPPRPLPRFATAGGAAGEVRARPREGGGGAFPLSTALCAHALPASPRARARCRAAGVASARGEAESWPGLAGSSFSAPVGRPRWGSVASFRRPARAGSRGGGPGRRRMCRRLWTRDGRRGGRGGGRSVHKTLDGGHWNRSG